MGGLKPPRKGFFLNITKSGTSLIILSIFIPILISFCIRNNVRYIGNYSVMFSNQSMKEKMHELSDFLSRTNRSLLYKTAHSKRSTEIDELTVTSTEGGVHTRRVGCREHSNGGQSCVISGIACVDVNAKMRRMNGATRHLVYLIDDNRRDGDPVTNDSWCENSARNSDPKLYGAREWPLREDYFAPRHSCLKAQWRTQSSLFGNTTAAPKIRWLHNIALIDLLHFRSNHNHHLLTDIVWMLDIALWQRSISKSNIFPVLFDVPEHVLLPQKLDDFNVQTGLDVNRLNLALVLGLDASELYNGQARGPDNRKYTKPFLEAYPAWKKKFIFYANEDDNNKNELICTRKLIVGPKLGNIGEEEVCNHLRRKTWELFNISPPPLTASGGYLQYHRPPRRVILLHRHLTRGFLNLEDVSAAIRAAAEEYNFEFELHTTDSLKTVEEQVRLFSRAGVLLTTHGSQSLGGIWMPRNSAIIEVFLPGYMDLAFEMLASTCNLWHYEIQGTVPDKYKKLHKRICGKKMLSIFNRCHQMKEYFVEAPVEETVKTTLVALKRLGHDLRSNTRG